MIMRGSRDEAEARRHIALWQGLIGRWNEDADEFRRAARGKASVSAFTLEDADRTQARIREALALCDTLTENFAPGHALRRDLLQIAAAFESLSESIAISAEAMGPRIAHNHEIAGLKYLVSALRRDAALQA